MHGCASWVTDDRGRSLHFQLAKHLCSWDNKEKYKSSSAATEASQLLSPCRFLFSSPSCQFARKSKNKAFESLRTRSRSRSLFDTPVILAAAKQVVSSDWRPRRISRRCGKKEAERRWRMRLLLHRVPTGWSCSFFLSSTCRWGQSAASDLTSGTGSSRTQHWQSSVEEKKG